MAKIVIETQDEMRPLFPRAEYAFASPEELKHAMVQAMANAPTRASNPPGFMYGDVSWNHEVMGHIVALGKSRLKGLGIDVDKFIEDLKFTLYSGGYAEQGYVSAKRNTSMQVTLAVWGRDQHYPESTANRVATEVSIDELCSKIESSTNGACSKMAAREIYEAMRIEYSDVSHPECWLIKPGTCGIVFGRFALFFEFSGE